MVRLGRHRQRASRSGSDNVFRAVLADGSRVRRRALVRHHHQPCSTAGSPPSDMRRTGRTRALLDLIAVRLPDPIDASPAEPVSIAALGMI